AKGFNQVHIYTRDYNEPFGYLVVFNTSPLDLKFSLSHSTQRTPFVVHNNKTIFIIVINIYPHETTASKRGTLTTCEICEEDLIRVVAEVDLTSQTVDPS